MHRFGVIGAAMGVALLLGAAPLAAQIDYRNLDDERPVFSEDAYPVERYAFELLAPYTFEAEAGGEHAHLVAPEFEYGPFRNAQVSLKTAFAAVDNGPTTDWGLAGFRLGALYNFNSESRRLPALSLRTDLALPVGALAGDAARVTLKAIATRSWGFTRAHLNVVRSFGSEDDLARVDLAPRWAYSLAVDRTLFRSSLLLVGEGVVLRSVRGAPVQVNVASGVRYQRSPTLVFDLGLTRRLRDEAGPDFGVTVGVSHAFAVRGLMPRGPQ